MDAIALDFGLITLGHLSDLHGTDPTRAGLGTLLNKRFLGWLSWVLRRRRAYRPTVLDALIEDLRTQCPDQIAVTGDLTNISLEDEFVAAARLLASIGDADRVTVIPGNHDAYVELPFGKSWEHWADYLASDPNAESDPVEAGRRVEKPNANIIAYLNAGPSLRIRGDLALVGLCSALPTPPLFATGEVGARQLERLEGLLKDLGARGLCRVVLVHHPVLPANDSARRGLDDSRQLRDVLERSGAELVLHGHNHRTIVGYLEGQLNRIPVVGGRSASYSGPDARKNAEYHLYQIEARGAGGYQVSLRRRAWNAAVGEFEETEPQRELL